ncbi:uncharacterized protein KIAA1522 homolog isoform X2 [Solea solea]|uniref:uncharacterized protein KIAA1522 homolog isoform X2 n=1 Tax=Solea solea TaxID=90069 RepID=UPI00272BE096|nr:uncharacterized protein KIAA1522 homolog isoform X2 [Solea solea]
MSRRRSTGDLVPRDITQILAREARAQRGKKKPGSSLGQALSWLKGSRRKKNISNGLNRTGTGVADDKPGIQNQEPAKAGPKGNEDHKRLAVHYTTSQHHQENVFIEGSRPQYLEDLHTEALEGLKILQQEEHKNGENFADDESISSSDTLRPEQDISFKDGGECQDLEATTGNSDTTVATSVSTRPLLTPQGSTFKPPNTMKSVDTKSRKMNRRTTIMGIPNQVQKELALHRTSTFQPLVSVQHLNQDGQVTDSQSGVVIIPTVDGGSPAANKEGARVHLSELEAAKDEQLFNNHLQAMFRDEQTLDLGFGSSVCPTSNMRPKSLAVPGMTTSSTFCPSSMLSFLQESQGPVMSISPQATYLSTIIPNAVLPASIEVIEIDRSRSRTRGSSVNHGGSVLTVSKSSLGSRDSSVSPLLSRRSDGDGFQTDHSCKNSTLMPKSTSGSNWSESQCSKTIILNPSPVSSKGSPRIGNCHTVGLNEQGSQQEHCGGDQDHVSVCSSVSTISSPNSKGENIVIVQGSESGGSGSVTVEEDAKNKCNFARSLSVMKTKQPPAPPRRTNSLHSNKFKSSSRVLMESQDLNDLMSEEVETTTKHAVVKDDIKLVTGGRSKITNPVSSSAWSSSPEVSSSPMINTQNPSKDAEGPPQPLSESRSSSPQKTPSEEEGKFERTMSPSSGYSSQSGTPTLSPKGISPTSPEKQKKPIKPERSASRASSSAASPSSSLTSLSSGTSEPVNPDVSTCSTNLLPQVTSPTVIPNKLTPTNNSSTLRVECRDLLNIPPPPKVKAPCPPPPETWVHNRRTIEFLCGPISSVSKETHKPPKIHDSTVKHAEVQPKATEEEQDLFQNQIALVEPVTELSESEEKSEAFLATYPTDAHKDLESKECPGSKTEGVQTSADAQKPDQSSSPVVTSPSNQEIHQRKGPPPVMKKPMTILHKDTPLSTEQPAETQQKEKSSRNQVEVNSSVENNVTSSHNGVIVLVDKSNNEMDRIEVPSMQTLSVEAPKVSKVSPPPTPPPAYHPTPPPSRKTPPSSVSTPPDDLQKVEEEMPVVESCWPPPPPPLEGDSVFDGEDEVDFPPPPPPFLTDNVPDVIDSCVKQLDLLSGCTVAKQDVGDTNKDSGEGGTVIQEHKPHLPDTVPQSEVYDNKAEVTVQLSTSNCDDEGYCKPEEPVSSLPDTVPPPPVEGPPMPTITQAENLVSVSALVPSNSFQRRDSLKTEDQSSSGPTVSAQSPVIVPVAPPIPTETQAVNFRRQPSIAYRDTRSKELLPRHRSAPIPKEDANIPLVTPSLLQMVRLRSVNVNEDQMSATSEDKPISHGAPVQENCPVSVPGHQHIPQKPIRKSLSLKSSPQLFTPSSVTMNSPSVRLQEAIRMKTAAMSARDGLPSRLGVRSLPYNCISEPAALSLKSPEGCDMHMSPASTASFIFSRSAKKVVIETAATSTCEAQATLKKSLAAELVQVSDQPRASTVSNGGVKCDKVPPPVARKPVHGNINPPTHHPVCSGKTENSVKGNGAIGEVQHGISGITSPETTTTRVTADTIETLF